MRPLAHLFLTAVFFFILRYFFPINFNALLIALFLTIAIDAFDHGIILLFAGNPLAMKIKKMFFSGKFFQAYQLYYSTRREYKGKFIPLHNLLMLFSLTILLIYRFDIIIFLGIYFHLLCDFFNEFYNHKGLHDVWTFGLIKK